MSQMARLDKMIAELFLYDHVLFKAWNFLAKVENNQIKTARIMNNGGQPRFEVNSNWLATLSDKDLKMFVTIDGLRIILKHPFERVKPNPLYSIMSSNVVLSEYMGTQLELPEAKEIFGHLVKDENYEKLRQVYEETQSGSMMDSEIEEYYGMTKEDIETAWLTHPAQFDSDEQITKQYFEFYYSLFKDDTTKESMSAYFKNNPLDKQAGQSEGSGDGSGESEEQQEGQAGEGLSDHTNDLQSLMEQAVGWDEGSFIKESLDEAIREAQATNSWGSVTGNFKELIVASLQKKVSFAGTIRKWATKSTMGFKKKTINRLKPSRRFGYLQPGSKYEGQPRILVAVDISGSMSNQTLTRCFGLINGIVRSVECQVDVIQFDCEIKGEIEKDVRVKKKWDLKGRGGTDFGAVVDLVDKKNKGVYSGVVVLTDGHAASPKKSSTQKNWIWVIDTKANYESTKKTFGYGNVTFIK